MAPRGVENCKGYNVEIFLKEVYLLVWLLLSVQQNTWWYAAMHDWTPNWKDDDESYHNMLGGISHHLPENIEKVQEKQFKIVDPPLKV